MHWLLKLPLDGQRVHVHPLAKARRARTPSDKAGDGETPVGKNWNMKETKVLALLSRMSLVPE